MNRHTPDRHRRSEIDALVSDADSPTLSGSGLTRRDAILTDLLQKAPGIRRTRVVRRVAFNSAPVLLVLLALFAVRPRTTHTPLVPAPIASDVHPGSVPPMMPSNPVIDPATTAPPRFASVVSTADRAFGDRIVSTVSTRQLDLRVEVITIDDRTLVELLALEGRSDGIVRIGDRAMLASDLPLRSDVMPAHPAGNWPPTPHTRATLGL